MSAYRIRRSLSRLTVAKYFVLLWSTIILRPTSSDSHSLRKVIIASSSFREFHNDARGILPREVGT